jgi:glucose/mannose transport system permease protein
LKSRTQKTIKFFAIVTAVILSIAYLLPIYVMVLTSLKTPYEITQRTYLIPSVDLHPENYAKAFSLVKNALLNSIIISSSVTAISSFIGGLSGFYLSRFRTKLSMILFVLVGISLYLPYQAILIPLVQFVAKTRLALTHAGMILSYSILNVPLASILMGTFFMSIPREIEEAAEMDGATKRQIFFKIVSPMALPGYASTAILVFTQVWNEFLLALTLSTPQTTTLQVKLAEVKGSFVALYNLQMAAAIIGIIVPVGFFLLLGRYFIKGILAGALKG